MNRLHKKVLFSFVAILGMIAVHFLLPSTVFAQGDGGCEKLIGSINFAAEKDTRFTGVLSMVPQICRPGDLIAMVMNIMFAFAGGIAVLFIMIGGYRYMASGGNEEMASTGKKTLIYAIIGLVVIIMATAIVNIVMDLLTRGSGATSQVNTNNRTTPTQNNPLNTTANPPTNNFNNQNTEQAASKVQYSGDISGSGFSRSLYVLVNADDPELEVLCGKGEKYASVSIDGGFEESGNFDALGRAAINISIPDDQAHEYQVSVCSYEIRNPQKIPAGSF
jgi:hypothetical protein